MAQHRQSAPERFVRRDHNQIPVSEDHVAIGIRSSTKPGRSRRSTRSDKSRSRFFIGVAVSVLLLILSVTVLAYFLLSADKRNRNRAEDDELKSDSDFLTNVTRRETTLSVLAFGHGSEGHGRDKDAGGVELYNEGGLKELKKYEAEYEASMKNIGQSGKESGIIKDNKDFEQQNEAIDDGDKEYDDGFDFNDPREEDYDFEHENEHHTDSWRITDFHHESTIKDKNVDKEDVKDRTNSTKDHPSLNLGGSSNVSDSGHTRYLDDQPIIKASPESKKKPKRHKFGSCEMKTMNSTAQLVEPPESSKFARFSLQYKTMEENPQSRENWEPRFSGHQSLEEREESFLVNDKTINCGFVKNPDVSQIGFDLAEDDSKYIRRCHIAVSSCIFGNSDRLRSPTSKVVTRLSRKNVCFVMFVDEITLQTLSSEGQVPDRNGFIGLWKIVVVRKLPLTDMRRVGKIPKLLSHRLFTSARYSIWLDSKLRLQLDPLIILEYLLWRKGNEYAISNHYDRHCVWEEVAQNKRLNKYNHTIIDQQFEFYKADGLKRFNASDPNKLLPSNVPEGSFIVRAHTPMSNLFSCLWYNEVDRFTPRDQLSFAYTYQKLRRMNPDKRFYLNMFKDCERRTIAKLFHHRAEEKQRTVH